MYRSVTSGGTGTVAWSGPETITSVVETGFQSGLGIDYLLTQLVELA